MENIEQTLNEREITHGSWSEGAKVAQDLKQAMAPNKELRPAWVNEALDRISMKLSRIIVGNCLEPDHWKDLQGYARLPEREIELMGSKTMYLEGTGSAAAVAGTLAAARCPHEEVGV